MVVSARNVLVIFFVDVVVLIQDLYGWPDEPFEEMDSTLAVQQVLKYFDKLGCFKQDES